MSVNHGEECLVGTSSEASDCDTCVFHAKTAARDVDDSEVAAAGEFGRRAVERFARQQVRPEIQMAQLSQCGEGAGFNRRDLVVDELEHEQRRWQHTGVYHAERVAGHVQLLEVR